MSKKKIKKSPITITELLAINKTADCRRLLKDHKIDDARNYEDLQHKLVELYRSSPDKKDVERKIAMMHPHKDFILKYCGPAVEVPQEIKVGPGSPVKEEGPSKVIANDFKNDEGDRSGFDARYHSACGCQYSSFSGPTQQQQNTFALVAMVAIVGIIVYSMK